MYESLSVGTCDRGMAVQLVTLEAATDQPEGEHTRHGERERERHAEPHREAECRHGLGDRTPPQSLTQFVHSPRSSA
jgi:hypothetical protein